MKRKSVLVLATIGLMFLLLPTVKANGYWFPMELNQVLNRPILGLQHYHITKTTSHDREKFEFNWTSGVIAINFYIFTETNYLNWTQAQPSTPQIAVEDVTNDATIFDTSGTNRTWVFVWHNPTITSTQLIGMYERYRWIEVESQIPGFPWVAILLGTLCAITIGLLVRRRTRFE
ncbi:MAG: hypothetical protein Q6364_06130 [Candidatus Hermodarchaeota archaeon]|jgi:hypothetical protein|nr:hypothetical protein [Candidatus Hermodarchaeota archaeon]